MSEPTQQELDSYVYRIGYLAEAAWRAGLHEHAVLAVRRLLERYDIDPDYADELPVIQAELVRPYIKGMHPRD